MRRSVSITDEDASVFVSPVCVVAVSAGGVGRAIGVSGSLRRTTPLPIAMAVAITAVAVGPVGRGAPLDTTNSDLAAAAETMQSASTSETTWERARGVTSCKASGRSGRGTTP